MHSDTEIACVCTCGIAVCVCELCLFAVCVATVQQACGLCVASVDHVCAPTCSTRYLVDVDL